MKVNEADEEFVWEDFEPSATKSPEQLDFEDKCLSDDQEIIRTRTMKAKSTKVAWKKLYIQMEYCEGESVRSFIDKLNL